LPLYRQEVSLYTAVPAMALSYELHLLDNLQERIGHDTSANGDPAAWVRVIARHDTHGGSKAGIYGDKGADYSDDLSALQAGVDVYRGQHDNGDDAVGAYVALGQIAGDVKHFNGIAAGRDRLRNYTLGGYWTHVDPSGWYTDAVVQGSAYKVKASSTRMAPLRTAGRGVSASLEGGYAVSLSSGWVFVPQAQLVYRNVSFNDASDAASSVYFKQADGLAGRIGTEVKKSWALGDHGTRARSLSAWVRVDLWREFAASSDVAFSTPAAPVNFHSDLRRSWVGLRAGFTAELARNVFVYASAGHDFGVNDPSRGYSGKAGVQIRW